MKPGVWGPKKSLEPGSDENEITVVVLPWKLFSQTIIWAWFSGTPLIVWPHFLEIFIAVSTP